MASPAVPVDLPALRARYGRQHWRQNGHHYVRQNALNGVAVCVCCSREFHPISAGVACDEAELVRIRDERVAQVSKEGGRV